MKKCGICGCQFIPRTEKYVNCDKCSLERARALMLTLTPSDLKTAFTKLMWGDPDLVEWLESR